VNEPTPEQMTLLYMAVGKAQASVDAAHKTRKGQIGRQEYMYADLASVEEAIDTAPADNGLSIIQIPGRYTSDGTQELTTIIAHSGGGFISQASSIPCLATSHGSGSAITYLRRYALLSIFRILTEDDDGQGAMPEAKRGGHLAKAATEMGATRVESSVDRLTPEVLGALIASTNCPSKGILGAYFQDSDSLAPVKAADIVDWANNHPGASGVALLRLAAEHVVRRLPAGAMRDNAQRWLGENE